MGLIFSIAERHLNIYPFISTVKVQRYVEAKTGRQIDGRTVAGMRRKLHRNMVRAAA